MANYLFVYRASGLESSPAPSPEDQQAIMQKWGEWIGGGFEAGWMVEGGDALKDDGCIVRPDHAVTDGPYAETKEIVAGYSIVRADSLAEAAELAKSCPMLLVGGTVEVRETANVGV